MVLWLPELLFESIRLYLRENKTTLKLWICVWILFKNSHHLKIPIYKILQTYCHPSFFLPINDRSKSELYILQLICLFNRFFCNQSPLKSVELHTSLYIFSLLSFTSEETFPARWPLLYWFHIGCLQDSECNWARGVGRVHLDCLPAARSDQIASPREQSFWLQTWSIALLWKEHINQSFLFYTLSLLLLLYKYNQ